MTTRRDVFSLASDPECPNGVLRDALTDLARGEEVATVHIVYGRAGSYGDYEEWDVRAFLDPEAARECQEGLMAWVARHCVPEDNRLGTYYLPFETRQEIQEGRLDCPDVSLVNRFVFDNYRYSVREVPLG